MKFYETSKQYTLKKSTYISLRWIGIVGQIVSVYIVYFYFNFDFDFLYSNLIILIGILSNIYLILVYKKTQLSDRSAFIYLIIDIMQLSGLIFLTGGITNPFSILLIVPAIVSSTFLNLKSTINLSILTIIILLVLTVYNLPLTHYGELHFHVPDTYLYALPIAIIITLTFFSL